MRALYAALGVLGTVLPYGALAPFLIEPGAAPGLFLREGFGSPVPAFFGWDVIVASLALQAPQARGLSPRCLGTGPHIHRGLSHNVSS